MVVSRVLAAAVVAAGLGVGAAPAPASAAVAACRVNVVCVYNSGRTWMGQYSEYTSGFQSARSDITSAWNRTPTAVFFRYSSGRLSCIEGGREAGLSIAGYGYVTGIRLANQNSCVF